MFLLLKPGDDAQLKVTVTSPIITQRDRQYWQAVALLPKYCDTVRQSQSHIMSVSSTWLWVPIWEPLPYFCF